MLYFIGTPIGNLKDLSFRAVETLKSVDEIACEDTRHSLTLLTNYGIEKPLFSYHKFNEKECAEKIVEKLKEGKNIAVISDAGMPVISDPGNVLTEILSKENIPFTVIPGANAGLSALILSGLDASIFAFIGFLPEKNKERTKLLEKYKNLDMTLIFYSAPHDVKKDAQDIYKVFGKRKAVAVKEITKIHERALSFTLGDEFPEEPKGEYVLVVEKGEEDNPLLSLTEEEHVKFYLDKGIDKKEAIKLVAKERGVSKSSLYKYTVEN